MADVGTDAFERLLERYDRCFYDRDLDALRALHVADGNVVYFDNHAGGDALSLDEHLMHVARFFEEGAVVPLLHERLRVQRWGDAACLTALVRYGTRPRPAVRATFVLERQAGAWRIRHVHFSTDPNEVGTD